MLPRRGVCGGTTSACAENTFCPTLDTRAPRNYLRVRGEYIPMVTILMRFLELPPRARRIRGVTRTRTSTRRNYLRVRGEYNKLMGAGAKSLELPPRARRIRFGGGGENSIHGTTSACAENTIRWGWSE